MKCYLCDGPHLIRDCPKKKSFNSIAFEDENEEARLSSMRLLNSVATEETTMKKGRVLMFINAKLNKEHVKTLIDTGASHNFLSEKEDRKMNIQYT